MITSNRDGQMYAYRNSFKEINELIISKKEEGYYITDFDFGDGIYSVILEKGSEILEQFHWWSKTFDVEKISEIWGKEYRITHLFNDGTDWIYVFSKLTSIKSQAYEKSIEFPSEQITKRWNDGFSISKIAYGANEWIIVFLKDIEYNSGWATRKKLDLDELKKWTSEEKVLTDLVWGENTWAIGYGKHKKYKYQIIETSTKFPSEIIKNRWEDGYDLTLCAYGDGRWFVAFSTKNKELVISNERNRLSKELEVFFLKIKELYTEKNYEEVINLFENNINSKDNEDCVNYYLWSLWLNNGTEEKSFNLSCEYNSKFNTNRWNILKGHYSKWKKWYDNALIFYKGSSEKDYNEVLSIFEEFRKLYEEKRYNDVIDFFQNKLSKSISKNHLDIASNYLWALYKNPGTETTAYNEFNRFNKEFPNESEILNVGGYITQWLGSINANIVKIEESIIIFKSLNKKEELEKSKEKLRILKIKLKEDEKKFKLDEKEKERALKLEEKEKGKKEKLEEKEKEKENIEKQHKLKSSRGEVFCIYCGMSEGATGTYAYCDGRKNGHNYVFMKDKKDRWHLQCNKCGTSKSHSRDYCS